MPKIPFAPAQKDQPFVPGAEPDMASAGLQGAAVARAAQTAGAGFERYGNADLYLKRAEKVIKLSTARLDVDNDLHELKKRYEADTDYANMPTKYEAEKQAIIDKYQKQLGEEEEVWRAFAPGLNAKLERARVDVNYMARTGFIAEAKATALDNYDRAIRIYGETQDPREKDNLLLDIELWRKAGLLTPEEVRKMKYGIDNKAEVFYVQMMREQDPEGADRYLNEKNEAGQYVNATSLSLEQRNQLIRGTKADVQAYKRDTIAQQKERDRVAKDELKKAQNKTGDDFITKFTEGKLTEREVLRSNLDPTGENSKEHWIEKLRKKPADPAGYRTDKVVESTMYSRIVRDPETVKDSEILDLIGKSDENGKGGLSQDDAKKLIDEKRTRLKEPKDPAETAVLDNLKRDRNAGAFGEDQEGDLEYAKQVEAFKKWRKANPKEDPSVYYETITKPYKQGLIGQWLDFAWPDKVDPKRRREEMNLPENANYAGGANRQAGAKPEPRTITYTNADLEYTAQKHGITVDEVKKRLGIR